jgi:hypothetical protein
MVRTTDLPKWLAALRVRPDAYDISGGGANVAYIIRLNASYWEVFYSDRGYQNSYVALPDESAAYAHFCTLIKKRAHDQSGLKLHNRVGENQFAGPVGM